MAGAPILARRGCGEAVPVVPSIFSPSSSSPSGGSMIFRLQIWGIS